LDTDRWFAAKQANSKVIAIAAEIMTINFFVGTVRISGHYSRNKQLARVQND
jgi:hypothetical protein